MTMKNGRLAGLNELWPADRNATPWAATPDGSWTRMVGAGVNPDISDPRLAVSPPPAKTLASTKREASEGAVRATGGSETGRGRPAS
jgi:hypothetical protein